MVEDKGEDWMVKEVRKMRELISKGARTTRGALDAVERTLWPDGSFILPWAQGPLTLGT